MLAARWFERAAQAKDDLGAFNLAVMLDEGKLVPEDNAKAAKFYAIAAERGNVDAMVNLAMMLQAGEGVARDTAAARDLLTKAAIAGDDGAIAALATEPAETAMIDDGVTGSIAAAAPVLKKMARLQ